VDSLLRVSYPNHKILIVDNGSVDGSVIAFKDRFPQVECLENGGNLGYAGGNNEGIERAVSAGADYVILLNNDTVVDSGFVGRLVEAATASPKAAFWGPTILYLDKPTIVWSAGGRIEWVREPVHIGKDLEEDTRDTRPRDVDYVTGCCLMARTLAIREIGLMDARFFLLFEEADWCVRARKAGWRVMYVPQARIWHAVSQSFGGQSSGVYRYYYSRNQLLFLSKHLQGLTRFKALFYAHYRELRLVIWYSLALRRVDVALASLQGVADFWLNRSGPRPALTG
jgi:GT2 family glycosyltransferase